VRVRQVVGLVLCIAGLGFLAASAWAVSLPAGLAAVGLALVILEWRISP